MWSSIFINIIISIIIIFIAHSLWNHIQNTYSTKKTKDLIGSQIQKYKSMMEELERQKENTNENSPDISMEKDLEKWMEESLQTEFPNNNI
jgi:predicted PurR-regulated permease PerM